MTPESEAELSEMLKSADKPVRVLGAGTRDYGRPLAGTPLSTTRLSGVQLYDPGALTIVVQAGTAVQEIDETLAEQGQRLPFEPMDHRPLLGTTGNPTIGGVVAANVSGPRRVQLGACRDYLLGVRFVDGSGNIVKNGGRVMKNVTGYDLVKLLAGSHGTLGVISEVAFKVLPQTDVTATLIIGGLTDINAQKAMSAALSSPFQISGAAHQPMGPPGHPTTSIRIEGFEKSVRYRVQKLLTLLSPWGDISVEDDPKRNATLWNDIRNVVSFADVPGDVWKISVKPSDGPVIGERAGARGLLYDWGGGLVWALVDKGVDLRHRIGEFDGHATLIRADKDTKSAISTFHPEPEVLAAIGQGLRQRFDPREILNPGLMG